MRATVSTLRRLALALGLLAFAALAAAQLRSIPTTAERAVMRHVSGSIVTLDGERAQLGAGAQIRDAYNRVVLPTHFPPDTLVKYTRDPQGDVHRVWILTPTEAAQPDPQR